MASLIAANPQEGLEGDGDDSLFGGDEADYLFGGGDGSAQHDQIWRINPGSGANAKGTAFYWIDFDTCIDCGICLQVCPVAGAIIPEEQASLQKAG